MLSRLTNIFTSMKNTHKVLLIILLGTILRLSFFVGTGTSDELNYYRYAHEESNGNFSIEINHFSFRLGIIYPTALLFSVFGVNEFTGNFIVILTSILGIPLIYFLGKEFFGNSNGLWAAFLLAIFPLDVFYSTRLMPEIPAVFFMGLTMLFFIRGEKSGDRERKWAYFFGSGISFGLAYLMKETSILLLLFFGTYCLAKRKFSSYYFLVGFGLALGISTILLASYMDTGNLFFQHQSNAKEEIPFLKEFYLHYFTFEGRLVRLFAYTPYTFLTSPYLGLFFLFAAIAAAYFIIKKNQNAQIPLFWGISLLLYLNFGTISFTEFVPFPIEVRHFSFVTYPLLILLAAFLDERIMKKWKVLALAIIITCSSISLIFLNDRNQAAAIKEAYVFLKEKPELPIYTDERTELVLEYLFEFSRDGTIIPFDKTLFETSFGKEEIAMLNLTKKEQSYVLIHSHLEEKLLISNGHSKILFSKNTALPPQWKLEQTITNKEGTLFVYLVQ